MINLNLYEPQPAPQVPELLSGGGEWEVIETSEQPPTQRVVTPSP